jgi:hypothetical protein
MFHWDHSKRNTAVGRNLGVSAHAHTGHWLALGERGLRHADELDYLIRRWVIADHPLNQPRAVKRIQCKATGYCSDLLAPLCWRG